jgi:hypothetical protein
VDQSSRGTLLDRRSKKVVAVQLFPFSNEIPEARTFAVLLEDELSAAESVHEGFGFRYASGEMVPQLEPENVRVCDGWNDEVAGIRASSATEMNSR